MKFHVGIDIEAADEEEAEEKFLDMDFEDLIKGSDDMPEIDIDSVDLLPHKVNKAVT
jgi:hypothetical protein